jgi:drug/metabolite transporter (DMT)-like permease
LSKRTLAILAAIGATTIYALNHTIAKGIMPDYVKPYGLVMLRVIGASALFWLISFLGPKENIAKKDFRRILLCALFGMGLNMLFFFKGLSLTTPINSSVIRSHFIGVADQGKIITKKSRWNFCWIRRCFGSYLFCR